MGESLDTSKYKDLGKITMKINVLVDQLHDNNQNLLKFFRNKSLLKFGEDLQTEELQKKMHLYIKKAQEISGNKLSNFHKIRQNIHYLSSSAQRELLNILGEINKEVSLQNKKSINDLNRVGLWFMALCFIEVILVWSMVFKPLYNAIVIQSEGLIEAVYEAQSASKSKTDFLANISHEIRTPMTAILGYSELLENSKNLHEEEVKEAVTIMNKNAAHLLSLIDEILDVSKIEAGKIEISNEVVDLPKLLNEIYSLMQVKAETKGIKLIFDIDEKIPRFIYSDPKRVKQIIFNMLGNGIKFTDEGHVKLFVSYRKNSKKLIILIEDTGLGIPYDKKDKIFTLFEQADNSVSRKFGGTGLGLALSRGLAEKMGGSLILLETKASRGSKFQIVLAVEEASQKNMDVYSVNKQELKLAADEVKHTLEGIKVLVVDDAKENARLFRIYLEGAKAQVEIANNGDEAINKVQNSEYDIILLDLQMPGKDGYQVLKEMRDHHFFLKPIVALTAHAMAEEKKKTKAAGFDGHIVKPIRSEDLIEKIYYYSHLS